MTTPTPPLDLPAARALAAACQAHVAELTKGWEIREGKNGEMGVFLVKYNVRIATFAPGSRTDAMNIKAILGELCTAAPQLAALVGRLADECEAMRAAAQYVEGSLSQVPDGVQVPPIVTMDCRDKLRAALEAK